MSRWIMLICLSILPIAIGGCSMCCGPYDFEYPILENSRYVRMDPEHGRVGSILSDPNVPPGTTPLANVDVPQVDKPQEEDLDGGEDDPNFDDGTEGSSDGMETDANRDRDLRSPTIDTNAQRRAPETRSGTSARLPRLQLFGRRDRTR